jgi:O-antigen/teichoic acid export membrane protein
MEAISLVNYPLLLGIMAIAPLLIPILFGSGWEPSIVLVQGLAVVALMRLTMNPVGSLLLAKGRADKGFIWNLIILFIQSPMIYLGARLGGSIGLVISLLFIQFSLFCLAYLFLLRPIFGNCFGIFMRSLLPAIWMSIVMGVIVSLIPLLGLSSLQTLSLQIVTGIFVYAILHLSFYRDNLLKMFHLLFDRMEIVEASNQ